MKSYIKIPKDMFNDPQYKALSANAKLLYGLLLDRRSLSESNNLTDADGKTVVFCSRNNAGELLNLSTRSTQKVFEELKDAGLVCEKSRGVGKTYMLYVKNFRHRCTNSSAVDVQKLPTNNTELNNTDYNNTELNNYFENYFTINYHGMSVEDPEQSPPF